MLHRTTVLVLNRHWLAIDAVSPAEAFGHLARRTARALHVERDNIQPFDWEDWRELPLTEGSPSIGTPHGRVRIPTVLVLNRYAKVRLIVPTFGFRGLWERDRGRCQYTGRMLRPAEANIDHVVPRSRGGTDCWENCVLADRKVNSRKGSLTPEEAGLKLLAAPRVPRAVPASFRIRNTWNVEDWKHFI